MMVSAFILCLATTLACFWLSFIHSRSLHRVGWFLVAWGWAFTAMALYNSHSMLPTMFVGVLVGGLGVLCIVTEHTGTGP
jgi:hypothetical protein